MHLIFPPKPRYLYSKICNFSSPSFSNVSSLQFIVQASRPHLRPRYLMKKIWARSEFDAKVNGALSTDFDPRFLDRQKALEAAMNDMNNSFGKGSVTRLGSAGGALVETFQSGCLTLDFALGGGLPKGRIVEEKLEKKQKFRGKRKEMSQPISIHHNYPTNEII
ncbi:DNA repair protein recA homolog 1, chloroplastic-like [Olea europaea var. sylvestris]|uniref:DNA repair protein recA homolog 1, chloroplastic-like n=1 Tax=Olea europaea var. sylvestris TaxID=158386 RepID=UPI000C1D4554|nr:DNA repair protein recA homolog 1, chloroplastic-like [Olea europaea var. sylvestris]